MKPQPKYLIKEKDHGLQERDEFREMQLQLFTLFAQRNML